MAEVFQEPREAGLLKAVDLFAGAGGLSLGFHWAGFNVVWANEIDPNAAITYSHAFGVCPDPRSIVDVDPCEVMRSLGIREGDLDCMVGGPPCQAYSHYNHKRSMQDERSRLFEQYLRFVEAFQPRFVVIENVPGMLEIEGGAAVAGLYDGLQEKLGYRVSHRVLRAEDFGVPQERRRVFFIASRDDIDPTSAFPWPSGLSKYHDTPNVAETLAGLPEISNGSGEEQQSYPATSGCVDEWYHLLVRNPSGVVYNHVAPKLRKINLERMKHIPQGGSWRDIPHDLLPAGMTRAKRSDHTKRYGRLHPEGLACTILTKCDIHWGCYIHPFVDRAITVREAARFQGFPDSFRFYGPRVSQYKQVGNAVPPPLAFRIAEKISELIQTNKAGLREPVAENYACERMILSAS